MTRPVIEIRDLSKRYNIGLPSETEVLHGLSLRLEPGEFAALIGPSGSGKSTLLNIVGLLEPMTSGEYLLQGESVTGLADDALTLRRRRTLGFVFQFHHLLPEFTALENVTLPALMREGRLVGELKGAPLRCSLQGARFTQAVAAVQHVWPCWQPSLFLKSPQATHGLLGEVGHAVALADDHREDRYRRLQGSLHRPHAVAQGTRRLGVAFTYVTTATAAAGLLGAPVAAALLSC